MSAAPAVKVRPGQVWECLHKYDRGRTFQVLRIEHEAGKGADVVVCEILTNSNHTQTLIDARSTMPWERPSDRRGCETRIRIDRFRQTSSGYRLVEHAEEKTDDGTAGLDLDALRRLASSNPLLSWDSTQVATIRIQLPAVLAAVARAERIEAVARRALRGIDSLLRETDHLDEPEFAHLRDALNAASAEEGRDA